MGLAKRYFAEDPGREFLFEQAKSISLLQSPPSWGLAATTPADWVLKQRLRESRGMKSTNRRDRRRSRSRSLTRSTKVAVVAEDVNDIEEIAKYLDEKQRTLAVIASGYGPAGDDDEERRRRRRKMLMWGAVAVALVAVSYAVVTQYGGPAAALSSLDSTGEASSGKIERDLLETNERPSKPVMPVERSREQQSSRRESAGARESASARSSNERAAQMQSPRERVSSRPKIIEFEVNPQGSVDSAPLSRTPHKANVAMSRSSSSSSSPKVTVSAGRTSSGTKLLMEKIDLTKDSTADGSATGTSGLVVPGPVRYMKGLLLSTRQALNGIDKLPGAQWAQGVYQDIRHAVDDIDPDLILPGVSLVPDFLRRARSDARAAVGSGLCKARQVVGGSERAQYVKEAIGDTTGRGRHLVRDALKIIHGQGARALKSARVALAENEAEVVVL